MIGLTATDCLSLVIVAVDQRGVIVPPMTKKNSAQLIPRFRRPLLVPSPQYRKWESAGKREMLRRGLCKRDGKRTVWAGELVTWPVNCRAMIYRRANIGDAVGYYQAVGDFLEEIQVIINDRFIRQWDGSRLLKDPNRPRIEVELTRLAPAERELF